MRITMLNKYYPPHLGGIEYHLRDLAEALAARADTQVRAIVSNDTNETAEESINGVDVVRLARWREYSSTPIVPSMTSVLRAEATSADAAPDIFHLHFPYPWGEVSWLRARTNTPTVLTYHSDIVRQKAALELYRPFLRRVLDRVDLVIASSPNMVEHSEFLSEVSYKCRVVPFGIDVDAFAATPATERRARELREPHGERPVVLFVGRLIYYKGADVLVRAMASVPEADLVIIGSGALESELRELVRANGMTDRVTFLGGQPFDELVAWYHAADLFCLPSVARSEAFGLVQLEAHAAGTPVISTELTTGVPFANQHGETGLIVPPGDVGALAEAIRTLVDDADLRAALGLRALERVRSGFSIGRMVEDTRAVYAEALS